MRNINITSFPANTKTVKDVGKSQGFIPITVQYTMSADGSQITNVETWWQFEPYELAALFEGGFLKINIQGRAQPPILLEVLR
jgi:hypothetical protein